ncbi:unnamed protein product [Moneuplotes crassus]|uniref:uracil phosphoribosyltransferase n=1 Tax=Euplotes crassus TaxID=5936 RepID=A0AAD2D1F4_EUPCR|nr:unnamed protein product [Moneuplotes crassus]
MWPSKTWRRAFPKFWGNSGSLRFFTPTRMFNKQRLATAMLFSSTIGYLGLKKSWLSFGNNFECQGTQIEYSHENVTILDHSLIPFLLSKIRDPDCTPADFRRYSDRIMHLLIEEAIAAEPMKISRKKTLAGGEFDHYSLTKSAEDYCAVTIIRAGDSMLAKMFELIPGIKVGKILIQRDENSKDKHPIFYYSKLPRGISSKKVFILDPMLGTGGSCNLTIRKLKERGVKEENITFVNLISCPEGLAAVTDSHPGVKIITAVVDPCMNDNMYIEPGLGDFGDRFFNSD